MAKRRVEMDWQVFRGACGLAEYEWRPGSACKVLCSIQRNHDKERGLWYGLCRIDRCPLIKNGDIKVLKG